MPVHRRLGGAAVHRGAWRSLVAHSAGGRKVAGSNPVAPMPVLSRKALLRRGFPLGGGNLTVQSRSISTEHLPRMCTRDGTAAKGPRPRPPCPRSPGSSRTTPNTVSLKLGTDMSIDLARPDTRRHREAPSTNPDGFEPDLPH